MVGSATLVADVVTKTDGKIIELRVALLQRKGARQMGRQEVISLACQFGGRSSCQIKTFGIHKVPNFLCRSGFAHIKFQTTACIPSELVFYRSFNGAL